MKNLFLVILIGLPCGVFAGWESQEIYKGLRSNSAVANDFDGDGNMEVIFSIKGQTLLSSLDGKRRQQIATYVSIHSALVDFDNDGDLDYIGASRGQLFWLACPQKPWEQEWVFHNISTELQGTHAVDIADVDGDGKDDLIYAAPGSIGWLKNEGGSNGFIPQADLIGGLSNDVSSIDLVDYDQDGDKEIKYRQGNLSGLSENRGSEGFIPVSSYDSAEDFHFHQDDLNNDGKIRRTSGLCSFRLQSKQAVVS